MCRTTALIPFGTVKFQPPNGNLPMQPEAHVTTLLRSLDLSSRDLDKIRSGHEKWPRWCFAPFAVWATSVLRARRDLRKVNDLTCAVTVVPWRYSRNIYRFDADLYRELISTPFSGDLPEEILLRLPEWSVFIEILKAEKRALNSSGQSGHSLKSPEKSGQNFTFLMGAYAIMYTPNRRCEK